MAQLLGLALALVLLWLAWSWARRRVRAARLRWRRRVGAVTLLAQQIVVLAVIAPRQPQAPAPAPVALRADARTLGVEATRAAVLALCAAAFGVLLAWPLDRPSKRRAVP